MKAVVVEDRIVHVTNNGDTEIGTLPKGIGLERLRFTGTPPVVDLATLSEIWVREVGPRHFELHAMEVPNSQLVTMTYADRKRLVNDAGTIRVLTAEEIEQKVKDELKGMLKNRLRSRMKDRIGDNAEMLADLYKLVFLLAAATVGNHSGAQDLVTAMLLDIKDTYRLNEVGVRLPQVVQQLKDSMAQYYSDRDAIG